MEENKAWTWFKIIAVGFMIIIWCATYITAFTGVFIN